jgi:hypothetical protein
MNIININRTPYNFGFKEKRKLLNSLSEPTLRELERYFYKHFKTLPQDLPKVLEDLQEYIELADYNFKPIKKRAA